MTLTIMHVYDVLKLKSNEKEEPSCPFPLHKPKNN